MLVLLRKLRSLKMPLRLDLVESSYLYRFFRKLGLSDRPRLERESRVVLSALHGVPLKNLFKLKKVFRVWHLSYHPLVKIRFIVFFFFSKLFYRRVLALYVSSGLRVGLYRY